MKRLQSIGFLLTANTCVLVIALVSVLALSARDAWLREQTARHVLSDVNRMQQVLGASAQIRSELALTNLALDSIEPSSQTRLDLIARDQHRSETALAGIDADREHLSTDFDSATQHFEATRQEFAALFPKVHAAIRLPRSARADATAADWKAATTRLTRSLATLAQLLEQDAAGIDGLLDADLRMSDAAWNLRMEAGRERGYVQTAIIDNQRPTLATLEYLAEMKGMIGAHWNNVQSQASQTFTPPHLRAAINAAANAYFKRTLHQRDTLLDRLASGNKVSITGEQWVLLSNPGLASILKVATTALAQCGERAVMLAQDAHRAFLREAALMLLCLAFGALSMLMVALRIVAPIKRMTISLRAHQNSVGAFGYEARSDEIGEFARALTERDRLLAEVMAQRIARDAAVSANKVKSEFLASMSHELRTPLNAILGFSEVLKTQLFGPLGHPKYVEYADDVHKSGEHLLDLINDVLDLSKIDAGRMELRETWFCPKDLIADCVAMVRDRALDRCVLEAQVPEDLPDLHADKRLIKQVVLNLLSNAIKFTPEGGRVCVSVTLENSELQIAVRDTGIGMTAEEIGVAFSPYGQIDSKIARQQQGTGLGLPISRGLAQLHGGTLTVHSQKGMGTTIILTLPSQRVSQRQLAADSKTAA